MGIPSLSLYLQKSNILMRFYTVPLITLLILLTGCHRSATDDNIRKAEQLSDSHPRQSLNILETIPDTTLNNHDLFLLRFLKIKTEDNLSIPHTNDSILKPVLDYAEKNRRSVNYPEVLYLAGRVYSDIGDYPGALEYYHNALDELSASKDNVLERKLLLQISRIYFSCGLYEDSEKYVRQAIKMDSIQCDTVNLLYGKMNLAKIHNVRAEHAASDSLLNEVITLAKTFYPDVSDISTQDCGTDSSIAIIRHRIDSISGHPNHCIFSQPVFTDESIINSARYEYEIRQRKRFMAIQEFNNYVLWLANLFIVYSIVLVFFLIGVVIILILRLKNKQQKLELITAEKTIESLTAELTKCNELENSEPTKAEEQKHIIKQHLLKQAELISMQDDKEYLNSLHRVTSPELLEILLQSRQIPYDSPLWEEMLNSVLKLSPRFKLNLEILTEGQLTKSELEIAILIKYNLTTSSMSKILLRSKQAVHSRRQNLGKKIFGDNFNIKDVDAIIRIL